MSTKKEKKKKRNPTQQWSTQQRFRLKKCAFMNYPYKDTVTRKKKELKERNQTLFLENTYGPYEDYIQTRSNCQSVKSHLSKKKAEKDLDEKLERYIKDAGLCLYNTSRRWGERELTQFQLTSGCELSRRSTVKRSQAPPSKSKGGIPELISGVPYSFESRRMESALPVNSEIKQFIRNPDSLIKAPSRDIMAPGSSRQPTAQPYTFERTAGYSPVRDPPVKLENEVQSTEEDLGSDFEALEEEFNVSDKWNLLKLLHLVEPSSELKSTPEEHRL